MIADAKEAYKPSSGVVRLLTLPKKQPASRGTSGQAAPGSGSSVPSSSCEDPARKRRDPGTHRPHAGRRRRRGERPGETPGRWHPRPAGPPRRAVWKYQRGEPHRRPGARTPATARAPSGQAAADRPPSPALGLPRRRAPRAPSPGWQRRPLTPRRKQQQRRQRPSQRQQEPGPPALQVRPPIGRAATPGAAPIGWLAAAAESQAWGGPGRSCGSRGPIGWRGGVRIVRPRRAANEAGGRPGDVKDVMRRRPLPQVGRGGRGEAGAGFLSPRSPCAVPRPGGPRPGTLRLSPHGRPGCDRFRSCRETQSQGEEGSLSAAGGAGAAGRRETIVPQRSCPLPPSALLLTLRLKRRWLFYKSSTARWGCGLTRSLLFFGEEGQSGLCRQPRPLQRCLRRQGRGWWPCAYPQACK